MKAFLSESRHILVGVPPACGSHDQPIPLRIVWMLVMLALARTSVSGMEPCAQAVIHMKYGVGYTVSNILTGGFKFPDSVFCHR